MHFQASVLLLSSLSVFSLAAPAGQGTKASSTRAAKASSTSRPATGAAATNGTNNVVSDTQLLNAVNGWMNDTGKVTKFLNTATSFTGDEYTRQATIALNAEVDELNHKAVLDAGLGSMASVQAANDTLATKGTFQAVVDSLQAMVNEGPDTAQQRVTEINNNRCVNVLPNINAYFAAAGAPQSSAIVPTGCLEVAATNSGSVVPSGVPPPPGNNNGGNQITSAPTSSASSTSSSSSASAASTEAAGGNNNNNNNNNNENNRASTTTSSTSSTTTRAAQRNNNNNAGGNNNNKQ